MGTDPDGMARAEKTIKDICFIPEVKKFIKELLNQFNPMVHLLKFDKGTDGLLHISEICWKRLEKVEEELKEGDEVDVKLVSIDPKSGKMKLSRKILLEKPEKTQ